MAVTKNILPIAGYQVWTSTNAINGDVLGVYESLGRRGARSVVVEASGADVTVRFNVTKQIYKEHGADHNAWLGPVPNPSPLIVSEYEDTAAADIVVAAGTSKEWSSRDLTVGDIKVVGGIANARITVT